MVFDPLATDDGAPLDQAELMKRLQAAGAEHSSPAAEDKEALPSFPEPPTPDKTSSKEEQEESGGDDLVAQIRKNTQLPSEKEIQALKAKWAGLDLTVVPLLSDGGKDKKIRSVIVKPLNRAEWRGAQEVALTAAENSKKNPQDLFEEKVVSRAIVWPKMDLTLGFETERAGFVPTVYGVVERISWFFNVDNLLQVTFTL